MLLQQLIRIPSVNPDNAAADQAGVTHEQAMAENPGWGEKIKAPALPEAIDR